MGAMTKWTSLEFDVEQAETPVPTNAITTRMNKDLRILENILSLRVRMAQ
jgi:hypothetical protein